MTCTYNLDPLIRYNPKQELHLSPESNEGKKIIQQSLSLYERFVTQYSSFLNLNDPHTVAEVYQIAEISGIFEFAAEVRQKFFALDMHFYGVSYLWDMCVESCIYCPAAIQNRKKTKYKPLQLTIDEAVKDVEYVMQDGHRHLCLLTGEDPRKHPPAILAEYISALDKLGLKEIILNVEPPAHWDDFKLWRSAAKNTALQFRVFQETYNEQKYAQIHPHTKFGRKYDFHRRYHSQEMAIQFGFNQVGLGVLFGNHHLPIEEITALQTHANYLQQKTGHLPARICLPSAKYLETISVEIPFSLAVSNLYWKFSEVIYALARLAMPTIGIVSSERDESELLSILDRYATCTTLNVHPGVGDNIRYHEQKIMDEIHFEQAPSYSRNPNQMITSLKNRGYHAWLA